VADEADAEVLEVVGPRRRKCRDISRPSNSTQFQPTPTPRRSPRSVFGASRQLPDRLGEGPLTEPTADTRACRWELVKMPQRRHSQPGANGSSTVRKAASSIASACDDADRCAIGTNQRRSISFTTAIERAIRSDGIR